jgi:hypothetical protein
MAPVVTQNQTTHLARGCPHPTFWLLCWGNSCWLACGLLYQMTVVLTWHNWPRQGFDSPCDSDFYRGLTLAITTPIVLPLGCRGFVAPEYLAVQVPVRWRPCSRLLQKAILTCLETFAWVFLLDLAWWRYSYLSLRLWLSHIKPWSFFVSLISVPFMVHCFFVPCRILGTCNLAGVNSGRVA